MNLIRILISVLTIHARPTTSISNTRRESRLIGLNEHPGVRTTVVVVCIACVLSLSFVQGYRAGRLAEHKFKTSIADVLVFVLSFVCMAFAISTAVIAGGLGLATDAQCYAAIRLCIVFYGAGKTIIYLFLLERAHIVRAPFVPRKHDMVWLTGFCVIVVGFGGFVVYEFVTSFSELSREDGLCRCGIPPDAVLAVMTSDMVINVSLNGVFIWLLKPVLSSRANPTHFGTETSQTRNPIKNRSLSRAESIFRGLKKEKKDRMSFQDTVKDMLWRNVIGSTLILLFTVANGAVLLSVKEATLSHVISLTCLVDLTWSVLVINWLWLRSIDEPARTKPAQLATASLSPSQSQASNRQNSIGTAALSDKTEKDGK